MRKNPRPSPRTARRRSAALLGAWLAALAVCAACAAPRPGAGGAASSPAEIFRGVLGGNAGLSSVRAVAEARLSYAGRRVSLPGVLQLDGLDGFRLDLLDPLDRPIAMLYAEGGRLVQYRPGPQLGASLGVFPDACRGIDPADWVAAVLGSGTAPPAGERLLDRAVWGSDRSLELYRAGELRQSVRYRSAGARLVPLTATWYCGDEAVMRLRFREWLGGDTWRLPTRFEVEYPNAGLHVRIDLREIEGNPPPAAAGLLPRTGSSTRWTGWDLPR